MQMKHFMKTYTLDHELGNDAVEDAALKAQLLGGGALLAWGKERKGVKKERKKERKDDDGNDD